MSIQTIIWKIAKLILPPVQYGRFIGVKIGKNCYISTKRFSSEPYLIEIGNNVRIARNVSFYTHGGIWPFRKYNKTLDYFGKIKIGNFCYIGDDAKILPGITIEDECIIGAGAVVTKSIKKGLVVAGNPAIIVDTTENFLKKISQYDCHTKQFSYANKKKYLLNAPESIFIKKEFLQSKS